MTGKSVCLASSRLTRKLDTLDVWFDALRTLATRIHPDDHYFLTAEGTTTDIYVRHLARRFGFKVVNLSAIDTPPDSIDETLICQADQVYLLSVRSGGNVFRAAMSRLKSKLPPDEARSETSSQTRLLIAPELTRPKTQQALIDAGAVGWWLYPDPNHDDRPLTQKSPNRKWDRLPACQRSPSLTQESPTCNPAPIMSLSEFPSEDFLVHWTRRCHGPWADQATEQYLDDLIFKSQWRDHGELGTLCRILASGNVLASRQWTRGHCPVVSFSNRPLTELASLTVFRSHLSRWDFLPFGIAVERAWFEQSGGRPVIYGDETTWEQLPENDRPLFQRSKSRSSGIDWQIEQEWRWIGDLNLRKLPIESGAVFVETQTDAEIVSKISRWPVVVVGH